MKFQLPGLKASVRLFEKVDTVDPQYQIFDCGVEYECGAIDSIAAGGSFHTVHKLFNEEEAEALVAKGKRIRAEIERLEKEIADEEAAKAKTEAKTEESATAESAA